MERSISPRKDVFSGALEPASYWLMSVILNLQEFYKNSSWCYIVILKSATVRGSHHVILWTVQIVDLFYPHYNQLFIYQHMAGYFLHVSVHVCHTCIYIWIYFLHICIHIYTLFPKWDILLNWIYVISIHKNERFYICERRAGAVLPTTSLWSMLVGS